MTDIALCDVTAKLYRPPDALNLQPLSSHQTEETEEEVDLGWVNEENPISRKQRQGEGGQEFVSDELSEELVDAQQEEAKVSRTTLFYEPATCPLLTMLRFTEMH